MWWLTPKISWITTTPPLGVPFGVARYAPISPAFDLRRISSPMRIPPGCGRHWTWYCGAVQPAGPRAVPQKENHVRSQALRRRRDHGPADHAGPWLGAADDRRCRCSAGGDPSGPGLAGRRQPARLADWPHGARQPALETVRAWRRVARAVLGPARLCLADL